MSNNMTDYDKHNNNDVKDVAMAGQIHSSTLKTLDLTQKNVANPRILKPESPVDSTVVTEFQRLRRLRRRHSESNLLRNEAGLPGIVTRGPHRHGLSSSLNSSGSTNSIISSPGASNSEGETILEFILNTNVPKTAESQRYIIDKDTSSSPITPGTPRPLSPVVSQRVAHLNPRVGLPLSHVSSLAGTSSPISHVSPLASQPSSPCSRRKPLPLHIEDAARTSHHSRPLAPVPPRPPDSPRTSFPDASKTPESPLGTAEENQDLCLSPRNQRCRVNSGSKYFETTLQDIAEHRERNGDAARKKRFGQQPPKMLVRRNSEPPNGMARRLRMAELVNEEIKRTPQVTFSQQILSEKHASNESICSSMCEDKQLKEKCLSWLETLENL